MNDIAILAPDERALRAALVSPRFQSGLARGRWRVVSICWPAVTIAVAANTPEYRDAELGLRFDLTSYPHRAPTASPWDLEADTLLAADQRPVGDRVGLVFRSDWENGRALYAPWDRVALEGHGDWAHRYPMHAWHQHRDLAFYLQNVYALLNVDVDQ